MKWLNNFVFLPLRLAGRLLIGAVGFGLMGLGLILMNEANLPVAGIPCLIVGLLLLVKAIF